MQNTLSQFKENIQRAKKQVEAALLMVEKVDPMIDVSDLFRSQYVFAVSALDRFAHELVRIGMFEIAEGKRIETQEFNTFFKESLKSIKSIKQLETPYAQILDKVVQGKHSLLSFQQPWSIAEALSHIYSGDLWEDIATELDSDGENLKARLRVIVNRRNTIAHEADMNPMNPGFLFEITVQETEETIDFVEQIGEAIYKIVA